jgi:subtilase family serine protease
MHSQKILLALLIWTFPLQNVVLLGQSPRDKPIPHARITKAIREDNRIVTRGNTHPLARPEYESGLPSPDYRMERMILTLTADSAQQQALKDLLADQHNPKSPRYHQWLSPEEFGRQFGVSQADLDQVANWLRSHGFDVEEIPAGRLSILFSGNVSQVESAFHTPIHTYRVNGETHHANAVDPEIPGELADVVQGVVSLHDFRSYPAHTKLGTIAAPQYSAGGGRFYMAPADFATIYHLGPLYQNAIDGNGQNIAIVGRCNINISDVQTFRSYFGLPAKDPTVIVNGIDPGIVSNDEVGEALLDVEWAGAVAKNAGVKFVVSASTNSTDGVNLSAQYIVNHNLAPVMSVSFGLCEALEGSAGNSFINNLWQQAAAQGISVFVSSGDSGAAGCDAASASTATHGNGVNALCSTPYSVCVGGTQFNDSNPATYWSAVSDPRTKSSALQYIPEVVWNESALATGGSGLWSSGGGPSVLYSKPSWQNLNGVPADGKRDVPDVSLTAAGHDGYLIYRNGQLAAASGTSATSASFAGLMSLVVQNMRAAQGNANPTFYALAKNQLSGGAPVFHDVTLGTNTVPGVTGFNAGPGYDLATGLGSPDAAALVNHWSDGAVTTAALRLTLQTASIRLVQGATSSMSISVAATGSFSSNSAITLSASNLPSGLTARFSPNVLSPASNVSVLTLNASAYATPGTYNVQIAAVGAGISQQASLTVTLAVPADFALALNPSSITAWKGITATTPAKTTATVTLAGDFNSAVTLSASNLPKGMTAAFAPANLPAPGQGSSTLTVTVGLLVRPGDYNIQVSGSGGGKTHSTMLKVTVSLLPKL